MAAESTIMKRTTQRTVADAIEVEERADEYWREDENNSILPDRVPDLMRLARDEINSVEDQLPFSADKVTVVVVDQLYAAYAAASVCSNGEYRYVREPFGQPRWEVTEPPHRYVLFMSLRRLNHCLEEEARKTVRHELAHMAGWEEDLVTYEQRDNHAEWMDKLDAWD